MSETDIKEALKEAIKEWMDAKIILYDTSATLA